MLIKRSTDDADILFQYQVLLMPVCLPSWNDAFFFLF